jgi:hypothetical protein
MQYAGNRDFLACMIDLCILSTFFIHMSKTVRHARNAQETDQHT